MSTIVKCDVCGGVYNQSYLHAHKRLSHGKKERAKRTNSETEALESIVSIYAQLSEEGKKKLRARLAAQA